MQITQDTADHLGLNDRRNPSESVWGGAKYLRYLYLLTPSELDRKERWALALASYNIGIGHLKDAQKLAEQKKINPYSWYELKQVFPMLANADIAESLEYGYARGNETVQYVDRTLDFYKLLSLRD
jgi:membrane-bound lytic murein transglycosylase F